MTVITEDRLPVSTGDVVAGKYRVGRTLGLGGMACVVAATHETLGQRVALKVMLPAHLARADAVERFLREGRAAAQLENHHICKVLDVGELATGEPYLVMEYLEGRDLEQVLSTRGALPVEDAIEIVVQVCSALAEAHAKGIVHRDLKPSNLFIAPKADGRPQVKVLDFGISKIEAAGGKGPRVTLDGVAMGSPSYMSPEQIRSAADVDHRTDIWALGVVLYRMLAAREPFPGDTVAAIFEAIMEKPPLPMTDLQGYLPDGLEAIVMRCLAKDPKARFDSVGDLAGTISKLSSRSATFSFFPPAPASDPAVAVDSLATLSASKVGSKTATAWDNGPARKSVGTRRVVGAALLGFLVVAAGGFWAVKQMRRAPAMDSASAPPAAIEATAPAVAHAPTATATATATTTTTAAATATATASAEEPVAVVAASKPRPAARPTARPHAVAKPPPAQTFAPVAPPQQASAPPEATVEAPRHRTTW
jgi:serine/threonine-protein kinase